MNGWECKAGSSLLIPSNKKDKYHLHIVASSPQDADGYRPNSCVLLPITTIYEGLPDDGTCVLDENDGHPFIVHPSYVSYESARNSCSSEIIDFVIKGVYLPHHDAPPKMLAKIVTGIPESIHSPPWLADFQY